MNVFQPAFRRTTTKNTVSLSAGVASDYVKVTAGYNHHVRVYNAGSVTVFIEPGIAAVTASLPLAGTGGSSGTPGSMPIAPGSEEVLRLNAEAEEYIAAITASGTAVVYFTPGEGM